MATIKIVNCVVTILGPDGKLNQAETTIPNTALTAPIAADSNT
jgi:hypothetical protein